MVEISTFLIHVTIFRLAIVVAGVICIVLGYRLFVRGVWPQRDGGGGIDVDVAIAGSSFTLKNATPGAILSIFGMIIIAVLVVKHSPELNLKQLGEATRDLSLRGQEDSVEYLVMKGDEFFVEGKQDQAIVSYRSAFTRLAATMDRLASLYLKQEQVEEALPVARIAVHLEPRNATYLSTLSKIVSESGDREEALRLIERAVEIDESYRPMAEGLKDGRIGGP